MNTVGFGRFALLTVFVAALPVVSIAGPTVRVGARWMPPFNEASPRLLTQVQALVTAQRRHLDITAGGAFARLDPESEFDLRAFGGYLESLPEGFERRLDEVTEAKGADGRGATLTEELFAARANANGMRVGDVITVRVRQIAESVAAGGMSVAELQQASHDLYRLRFYGTYVDSLARPVVEMARLARRARTIEAAKEIARRVMGDPRYEPDIPPVSAQPLAPGGVVPEASLSKPTSPAVRPRSRGPHGR